MNDPIDKIFDHVRQTESELSGNAFMAQLRGEISHELVQKPVANFDWLLIVAAVLASCAVFFLTPLYSWLLALPAVLPTIGNLQVLILATALASVSFFVFFDWEFE